MTTKDGDRLNLLNFFSSSIMCYNILQTSNLSIFLNPAIFAPKSGRVVKDKKCTIFECQCSQHESALWEHYFYVSYWGRDRHFVWSSEPRKGLPVCRAKEIPSFLSQSKTLSIGPVPGIEPATSRSAVKRSTD